LVLRNGVPTPSEIIKTVARLLVLLAGRRIDPASVNVTIPADKPTVIPPEWTEIPVDDAFWRAWKLNALQMRYDGYRLCKIDGKWRAFYARKTAIA
jgi:hypothetical protein